MKLEANNLFTLTKSLFSFFSFRHAQKAKEKIFHFGAMFSCFLFFCLFSFSFSLYFFCGFVGHSVNVISAGQVSTEISSEVNCVNGRAYNQMIVPAQESSLNPPRAFFFDAFRGRN